MARSTQALSVPGAFSGRRSSIRASRRRAASIARFISSDGRAW